MLVIRRSSLEKCILKSFAHFSVGIVFVVAAELEQGVLHAFIPFFPQCS